MDNLNTADEEGRASLNGDETLLIFSGDHNTGVTFQLFVSKRNVTMDPFPSPTAPDQVLVAGINVNNNDYFDPFLTKDGLNLYLAPSLGGAPQQINVATRTGTDQSFGASTLVPVINSGSGDASPTLSPDERVLVFSSGRPLEWVGSAGRTSGTRPGRARRITSACRSCSRT